MLYRRGSRGRIGKNMKLRKIAYSAIALSKRKAIKREVKDKHGQNVADRVSI